MDDDKELHDLGDHLSFALPEDEDLEDEEMFESDGEESEEEYS